MIRSRGQLEATMDFAGDGYTDRGDRDKAGEDAVAHRVLQGMSTRRHGAARLDLCFLSKVL